jgi:hypothetical protein
LNKIRLPENFKLPVGSIEKAPKGFRMGSFWVKCDGRKIKSGELKGNCTPNLRNQSNIYDFYMRLR